MHIIVAHINRTEREAIGLAIRGLRPAVDVIMIDPNHLDAALESHHPHLVICDQLAALRQGKPMSWILIGSENADFAVSQLNAQPMRVSDHALQDLLFIIDEAVRIHQMTH